MRICIVFLMTAFCLVRPVFSAEIVIAELNLDQATNKVLEKNKSKVLNAKTETIDGKEVHVIKIVTEDGRVQHFKVDVDTGEVTK